MAAVALFAVESDMDECERYIQRCAIHKGVRLRHHNPTAAWPAGLECPQGHKIVDRWELYDTETGASVFCSARWGVLGVDGEPET